MVVLALGLLEELKVLFLGFRAAPRADTGVEERDDGARDKPFVVDIVIVRA